MTGVGKLTPTEAIRMMVMVFEQGGDLDTRIAGNGPTLREVVEKAIEEPVLYERPPRT